MAHDSAMRTAGLSLRLKPMDHRAGGKIGGALEPASVQHKGRVMDRLLDVVRAVSLGLQVPTVGPEVRLRLGLLLAGRLVRALVARLPVAPVIANRSLAVALRTKQKRLAVLLEGVHVPGSFEFHPLLAVGQHQQRGRLVGR